MSAMVYRGRGVVEGVSISGPSGSGMAVRNEDERLVTYVENKKAVRTARAFFDDLSELGRNSFRWLRELCLSGARAGDTEEDAFGLWQFLGGVFGSVLFAAFWFWIVPLLVSALILPDAGFFRALGEGLLRAAAFLLYLKWSMRYNDIKRIKGYQGACNMVLNAVDAGKDPEPAEVEKFSLRRPFFAGGHLLFLALFAIVVLSFAAPASPWGRLGLRILLLAVIFGGGSALFVAYRRNPENKLLALFAAPGFFFQRMLVMEPDDAQITTAIAALKITPGFLNEEAADIYADKDHCATRVDPDAMKRENRRWLCCCKQKTAASDAANEGKPQTEPAAEEDMTEEAYRRFEERYSSFDLRGDLGSRPSLQDPPQTADEAVSADPAPAAEEADSAALAAMQDAPEDAGEYTIISPLPSESAKAVEEDTARNLRVKEEKASVSGEDEALTKKTSGEKKTSGTKGSKKNPPSKKQGSAEKKAAQKRRKQK